ncbi:MAG: hypothetical protein R3B07_16835 [Polyangiaceae bacterium]
MARLLPLLRPLGAAIFSAGIIAACAEGGALPPKKPIQDGGAAGTGNDASANGGSENGGSGGTGVGAMGGDTVGGSGADGGSSTGGSSGTAGAGTGGVGNGGNAGSAGAGAGGAGNGGTSGAVNGGAAGSGNAGSAGSGGSGNAGTGAGGSGGTSCEIAKYNFDNCNDGWTNTGNADWACGNPTSGPGSDHTSGAGKAWSTNPSGNQGNCTDGAIESPVIDLSGAGANLRLRYWHWYDFRPCDSGAIPLICNLACIDQSAYAGGVVEVKNSSGSWVKVSPSSGKKLECYYQDSDGGMTCSPCAIDNQTGYSGSSGGWVQQEIDISGYAHSQFQVRFHSASYAADPCHPNKPGWTVDDVRIAPASCP